MCVFATLGPGTLAPVLFPAKLVAQWITRAHGVFAGSPAAVLGLMRRARNHEIPVSRYTLEHCRIDTVMSLLTLDAALVLFKYGQTKRSTGRGVVVLIDSISSQGMTTDGKNGHLIVAHTL
ncbi:hypothetical protein B0T19DRAFT_397867 [Cercophora scortea]|uniref:Uncharacterized protein n=1 Tax=Cercophora scortea TaxID=314031 RepID=A0AAE0IVH7_9PEZI|nr:hypothetical protein B0T19DRAFT_397867 [Cercophora scortea]